MGMDIYLTKREKDLDNLDGSLSLNNNNELIDEVISVLDGIVVGCDISISEEQANKILDNLKDRQKYLLSLKDDSYQKELDELEKAIEAFDDIVENFDFDNYVLYFYYDY